MAFYQYGNYSIPVKVMRNYLCDKFTAESIYLNFNLTCNGANNTLYDDTASNVVDPLPTSNRIYSDYGTLVLALCICVFVLGIAFNAGLLTLLLTQKRFFKPSWYYVCSLFVADVLMLFNMVAFVIAMLRPLYPLQGRLEVYLFPSLDIFLSSASMLSVAAIALDRMFTICMFKNLSIWYRRRKLLISKVVVPSIWLYCIAMLLASLVRVFAKTTDKYNVVLFWIAAVFALVGAVGVTGISYLVIAITYIKHRFWDTTKSTGNSSVESLTETQHRNGKLIRRNSPTKVAKAFWICLAPIPFIAGWSFFLGVQCYEIIFDVFLNSQALNLAMMFVPWIVSAFNPVMYFLIHKKLRNAVCRLVSKRFSKK